MTTKNARLSAGDLEFYREHGYLLVERLISEGDVLAVLEGIDRLLCAKLPGLAPGGAASAGAELQSRIMQLKVSDRQALASVYDAMRKLLPFWSILSGPRLTGAVGQLLRAETVGLAFRGCGIRLDIPGEDEWRSTLHQEYHSQMSSLRGVVAWFGLVPVSHDMGPVRVLDGSHREGLLPVRCLDPMNSGGNYTQTFVLADEGDLVTRYAPVSIETEPGDVLFLDFMTIHESGYNRSPGRSRITGQVRYFDMMEETAVRHGWKGGWQEGGDFTKLHPDKVVP
jgi:hypothetical protein